MKNIIEELKTKPGYQDIVDMMNARLIHNNRTIFDYPEDDPPCFDGIHEKYAHLMPKLQKVMEVWRRDFTLTQLPKVT